MNQTENYQLSLWDAEDRIQRTDFNADNAKLEEALVDLSAASGEHTAAIAKLGNCQIYTTSYVGTGTFGETAPNSLTFPRTPRFLMIAGYKGSDTLMGIPATGGATLFRVGSQGMANLSMTLSGNTVTWYSSSEYVQLNASGTTYQVLALLDAAQ